MTVGQADPLRAALNIYIDMPTVKNREGLLSEADAYRESWIVGQAASPTTTARKSIRREPTTTYDRRIEVERTVEGIPIRLALQERTSSSVGKPFWVLSWRTKYSAQGPNRRFYSMDNSYWKIPVGVALEMIEEMERRGGLGDEFLDWRQNSQPTVLDSAEMKPERKAEIFHQITGPDEDWGHDPFFVICTDPNKAWKKLFIVNPELNWVTFRSITTDPTYMPKKVLRPGEGWWLDNSMMDGGVQQMREFYKKLKAHTSG